jgi:copper(I)-binding protein
MLADLKSPLIKGQTVKVTLTFEHAGSVAIDFPVSGVGAAAPAGEMKGMNMKGM